MNKIKLFSPILILLVISVFLGCSSPVEERIHKMKGQTYADQAVALLENYASGAPLGSESEDFARLIKLVKEESPEQAAVVEEAFNSISAKPSGRVSTAKKALEKLKPAEEATATE